MSELYFRLGEIEGFTSNKLASKKADFAIPIRELLQNSLDARKTYNQQLQVDIYIEEINKEDIPHIGEYEKILNDAIKTLKEKNSYNKNSKQIVQSIKEELDKTKLDVLMFVDNGSGMNQDILEGLLEERSIKADESSGGSFGVGHLSSYFLSSLRYVLYATKYEDNGEIKPLFTGSPILAGHSDNESDRGSKGRILKEKPANEKKPKFSFPEEFPNFIKPRMGELQPTGSMIVVLGLSEIWGDKAEYAIVSNFFHAIAHTDLRVSINNKGETTIIDDDKVKSLIEKEKSNRNRRPGSDDILSGEAAYWACEAVFEGAQESLSLDNGDKVHSFIKNNVDCGSTIVLIRNGMVIARHDSMLSPAVENLRKSNDYSPFMAVIDVHREDAPRLFELVKGAEGPHHNQLERKRLIKKEEKELIKLFKELCEKMKTYLEKIEREGFDLPLFNLPSSEAIKSGESASAGGHPKSSNSAIKLKQQTTPKKPTQKDKNKKDRPTPEIHPRRLQSTKATRYSDEDGKLEIKIKITPTKQSDSSDKDNVYLSIALAEDSDRGVASEFVDFVNLSVNQKPCNDFVETIIKNKETGEEEIKHLQVKLGKLNIDEDYEIIAHTKKPDGFEDTRIDIKPIFSLKQEKGRKK